MTPAWSPSLAPLLASAARAAMIQPAVAPAGFTSITTFTGDNSASPGQPRGQGLYLTGLDRTTGDTFAVLALGVPWKGLVNQFNQILPSAPSGQNTAFGKLSEVTGARISVPIQITDTGVEAGFTSLFVAIYSQLWSPIWTNLNSFRSRIEQAGQLYVTGLGPGAPLALLAALDLRQGHRGFQGINPPKTAPQAYVFSAPPVADAKFRVYYEEKVVSGTFCVNAAVPEQTADFFPSEPNAASGYLLPGTLHGLQAKLPQFADPWLERSGGYYLTALGSPPEGSSPTSGTIGGGAAGFEKTTAHSMAMLCGVANQLRERPLAITPPVGDFQLKVTLSVGGVAWAGIFTHSSTSLVVAFRDTVSWDEMVQRQMPVIFKKPSFLAQDQGAAHSGVVGIYDDLRSELAKQLKALAGSSRPKVYCTGYGFGGALASLAGLDLVLQPAFFGQLPYAATYNFGAVRFADLVLAAVFDNKVGSLTYQVERPADILPSTPFPAFFETVGTRIPLLGTPAADEPASYHSLASYLELLNPFGQV